MIDFELSSHQEQLIEWARLFSDREIRRQARAFDERGDFPYETMLKAQSIGFMECFFPSSGITADFNATITNMLIVEELFRGCAGFAAPILSHLIASIPFALAEVAAGDQIDGVQPKSDGLHMRTTVLPDPMVKSHTSTFWGKREKGALVLSGTARAVINARHADSFVVLIPTMNDLGKITYYLSEVDSERVGILVDEQNIVVGLRASGLHDVTFDNIKLSEHELVYPDNSADLFVKTRDCFLAYLSVALLGIAKAALGNMRSLVNYGISTPHKIASSSVANQYVSETIDVKRTKIEAGRLLAWKLGWLLDKNQPSSDLALRVRSLCNNIAVETVISAVELTSGQGRIADFEAEKLLRDTRAIQRILTAW